MQLSQLNVNTYNFGLTAGQIFSSGRFSFPNSEGTVRHYIWVSSMQFGVGAGPWKGNAVAQESSDAHSLSQMDWEAMDGARGSQFSDPPQTFGSYPMFAVSDLPLTWPTTGWPAPQGVADTWVGTDTWNKWDLVGDRNAYAVFNDSYADRDGTAESAVLGLEVKFRAISYGALNTIYFQYEITNTSAHTFTNCYVGQNVDSGAPTTSDYAGRLQYDESRQLLYVQSGNYAAGQHSRVSTGEPLSFVGTQFIETPSGHFRRDGTGAYVTNTDDILTRVALLDWGDRVGLNDGEEAMYAAISGDAAMMPSDKAESVWKLSFNGGVPILKQDVNDYMNYNPSWASDSDCFYYVGSGPFTLGPNESVDYVIAAVAGFAEADLFSAADRAIDTYNAKFAGPAAPAAPANFKGNGTLAGPAGREFDSRLHAYAVYYAPSGNISLTWDPAASITTPDPSSGALDFEGIRIYRSEDRGRTWGLPITDSGGNQSGWVPVAQFDLENGITGDDGLSNVSLGDDTGISASWTDPNMFDGVEYWYAITSYDQGEFAGGVQTLASLESPMGSDPGFPTVIAVIAGSRPNGYIDGTASVSGVASPWNDPGATVSVAVMSEGDLTGADYLLTVGVGGDYGSVARTDGFSVTLDNVTAGTTVFSDLLPDDGTYGSGLLPIVDGLQIIVDSNFNSADADPHDRINYTFPADWAPFGGYEQLYGNDWFMWSSVDYTSYADATGNTFPAEVRFSLTNTQNAYRFWRNTTSMPPGVDNYSFKSYGTFPGTVWDVSDPANPRQVNVAYTVNTGDVTNGDDFDIDDNPLGGSTRHYMGVLTSDYSGATADTMYTTGGSRGYWNGNGNNNPIDIVWATIPGVADTFTAAEPDAATMLDGQTVVYGYDAPVAPGSSYSFSTTAGAIQDTAITMDDIRVVPNPYYILAEWDQSVNRRKIQFTNVPANSTVDIYTLSGELVASLDHHGDSAAPTGQKGYNSTTVGTVDWNIWTYEFTEAAYGLYIFVVKTDDGRTKVGKFAIIR